MLLRQLARPLRVPDGALQPREMVQEQLAHLRFQLGDASRIAGAGDRRRLHLQHRHVVGGPALLAIDVLEPGRRPDVRRVAVDGVDQVGLGALGVAQLVDAQLGGQVEELARLGVVLDRLRARFVERDQLSCFCACRYALRSATNASVSAAFLSIAASYSRTVGMRDVVFAGEPVTTGRHGAGKK